MTLRAFVTGGTGFVGANLIRLLLTKGYAVRALARNHSSLANLQDLEIDIVNGDLSDTDQLAAQMRGCQVVFHVAAHYSLWQRDKHALYQSNVMGTRNILTAARQARVERTIYTSSVAAIGVPGDGSVATETYQSPPEKLIGDYKKSKYYAEQEAHQAAQAGQDLVIVNPSTPIGPWDIKPTPTGDMVLRFLRRQMPTYLDTGLNLIHVQDVVLGHWLALERGQTGQRYILGNQNLTMQQILQELSRITQIPAPQRPIPAWLPLSVAWVDEIVLTRLGKSPSVPLDGVKMARQKMFYDASKAVQELGLPQTPVPQALKEAVDWFRAQGYVQG